MVAKLSDSWVVWRLRDEVVDWRGLGPVPNLPIARYLNGPSNKEDKFGERHDGLMAKVVAGFQGLDYNWDMGVYVVGGQLRDPELGRSLGTPGVGFGLNASNLYNYAIDPPSVSTDPSSQPADAPLKPFGDRTMAYWDEQEVDPDASWTKKAGLYLERGIRAATVESISIVRDTYVHATDASPDRKSGLYGFVYQQALDGKSGWETAVIAVGHGVNGAIETGQGLLDGDPEAYATIAPMLVTAPLAFATGGASLAGSVATYGLRSLVVSSKLAKRVGGIALDAGKIASQYRLVPSGMYSLPIGGKIVRVGGNAPDSFGRGEIVDSLSGTLQQHLGAIRKIVPDARVGFRGSLASGVKRAKDGNPERPFDPTDFDIDLFVVSDKLRRGRGFQVGPKPLRDLARQIDRELRALPEFDGLRGGKDKLQFRIWGSEELHRKATKGDSQIFFIGG